MTRSARIVRVAFGGAVAGTLLLLLTWYAAFHVGFVRRADTSVFWGFTALPNRAYPIASFIAQLCNPNPYVYLALGPVLVALATGRRRVAFVIALILLCANGTAEILKALLATPRVSITAASWPSGHATAAMSLAMCFVIAAPSRRRPAVGALGALFAVVVSYCFLFLGWHYPSDVFGGFLIAAIWTSLGIGTLAAYDSRHPRPVREREPGRVLSLRETVRPPAMALAGTAALITSIALLRPHAVVSYAHEHPAFFVVAAAIEVVGLGLATGLTLALRR